jgi:hypothetical protein
MRCFRSAISGLFFVLRKEQAHYGQSSGATVVQEAHPLLQGSDRSRQDARRTQELTKKRRYANGHG